MANDNDKKGTATGALSSNIKVGDNTFVGGQRQRDIGGTGEKVGNIQITNTYEPPPPSPSPPKDTGNDGK